MAKKKLSEKQKQFCEEYLIDLNATQSALRAGYSPKTAYAIGVENLKKPQIQEYITELREVVKERNNITIDELVGILSNIARFDPLDVLNEDGTVKDIKDMPINARKCIAGLDIDQYTTTEGTIGTVKRIKLVGKEGAIDKLMKHLGGYEKNNEQKKSNINLSNLSDETIRDILNAQSEQ